MTSHLHGLANSSCSRGLYFSPELGAITITKVKSVSDLDCFLQHQVSFVARRAPVTRDRPDQVQTLAVVVGDHHLDLVLESFPVVAVIGANMSPDILLRHSLVEDVPDRWEL